MQKPTAPLLEAMGDRPAPPATKLIDAAWPQIAFVMLRIFAARGDWFRVHELRAFAASRGLAEPRDLRRWGPLLQRAAREGVIVKVGGAARGAVWKRATP